MNLTPFSIDVFSIAYYYQFVKSFGIKLKQCQKTKQKTAYFSHFLSRQRAKRGKRGRGGNSLPLQPLSFPPRPSGLGFCETPVAFRSKKVRAFSSIGHHS
jgi:hypothetical protein